ncbi:MAG: tetratricopeptide repeat protein [Coleofasciculaceae cyanobacterium]
MHQLPPALAQFTGRQAELEHITAVLRHDKKLVITGVAGVGKSALSIQSAHLLKSDFPDAQLYVNLRGTESQPLEPLQVLASFIRALAGNDLPMPETLTERSNLYRSLLSKKRAVIILDNAHSEAQIYPLLPENDNAVIITTRQEMVNLEGAASLEIEAMSEQDALKLLEYWIGSDRYQAETASATSIINICSQLPLAICIIGGTLQNQSDRQLADIAQQLTNERKRLSSLRWSDLAVRVSLALSYQELDNISARLFRLLGLLTGTTFSGALATTLLETEPTIAQAALQQLIDRKLIEIASENRYHFHDLVRLFAKGQLAQEARQEARQAARLRLSRWYLETSQIMDLALSKPNYQLNQVGNKYTTVLNWFELEQTNLLASLKWAYQAEAWEIVAALATNLVNFFDAYGCWDDWQQTHEFALEAVQTLEQLNDHSMIDNSEVRCQKAQILTNLGNVYSRQSDWQKAAASYQASMSLFEELENPLAVAKIMGNLANVEAGQGNWDNASDRYQHSLEMFHQLNEPTAEAQTLANFGILWAQQNQVEKAAALWQEALTKLASDLPKAKLIEEWLNLTKSSLLESPPANLETTQPVLVESPSANLETTQPVLVKSPPANLETTQPVLVESPPANLETTQPKNLTIVLGVMVVIAIAFFLVFIA